VTGNAGDEVLGGHRAGVLRAVVRRRGRGLTAADWRHAVACAAPSPVRNRLGHPAVEDANWLRPAARRVGLVETMQREAARPLRWDRSVWAAALALRAVMIGNRTRERIVADCDSELVEPVRTPGFLTSYAAFGGRWGGLGRAAGTRLLAAGLLLDAVIDRRQKAYFNASRFGSLSRAFGRDWDGRGVDETLVNSVALRAAWLADVPSAATAMLLQQAWLAGQNGAL